MKRDTLAEKKIIEFLLDNPGEKFYLTQIARETGVSDSTIHQILGKKEQEGLVKKEKLGNLSLYFVEPADPVIKQMKILRTTEFLKPLVTKLADFSQKVVLFGSCARGENGRGSDIDLFVLTSEPRRVRRTIFNLRLGRKVQAVVKSFPEWVEFKEKDKFLYGEIRNGLVLWEEK